MMQIMLEKRERTDCGENTKNIDGDLYRGGL